MADLNPANPSALEVCTMRALQFGVAIITAGIPAFSATIAGRTPAGVPVPAANRTAIIEAAQGNPLALVELPRFGGRIEERLGALPLTERLVAVFGAPTAGGALETKVPGTDFEAAVTVAGEIQQLAAGNLSTKTYVFILIPAAA